MEFPYLLGSTDPCPTAVTMEPFSTSVFKDLTWIFATTTKICTRGGSTQHRCQGFFTTSTPAYSSVHHFNADGEVWVTHLSAIHFQGQFIWQVSCYTLLSGFQLPWPPSCCLDELTPFVVSDEHIFRHLNLPFGSSRITSSAYQKWPTRNSQSLSGPIKRWLVLTYLKFENRLRSFWPQGLQSFALSHKSDNEFLLSWGKLWQEPATRWFN